MHCAYDQVPLQIDITCTWILSMKIACNTKSGTSENTSIFYRVIHQKIYCSQKPIHLHQNELAEFGNSKKGNIGAVK